MIRLTWSLARPWRTRGQCVGHPANFLAESRGRMQGPTAAPWFLGRGMVSCNSSMLNRIRLAAGIDSKSATWSGWSR